MAAKYHFKSPAELQESLRTTAPAPRKRKMTRGRIIFIVDVAILLIVAGILYHQGLLSRKDAASVSTINLGPAEISASVTGIKADAAAVEFYLNVKNNGVNPLRFPGKEGRFTLQSARVEFHNEGLLLHAAPFTFPHQTITAGQTAIYPLKVEFPAAARGKHKLVKPSLRFKLQGGEFTLNFPRIRVL